MRLVREASASRIRLLPVEPKDSSFVSTLNTITNFNRFLGIQRCDGVLALLQEIQNLFRVIALRDHIQKVQLCQPEEVSGGFLLDQLLLQTNRTQQKLQA